MLGRGPVIYSLHRIREWSARPSASQRSIRKAPDVAPLPNLAVYENHGGSGALRRGPGFRAGLWPQEARPARAGPTLAVTANGSLTRLVRGAMQPPRLSSDWSALDRRTKGVSTGLSRRERAASPCPVIPAIKHDGIMNEA